MKDAHCHLDRMDDPMAAWRRARDANVDGLLVAGVDPAGWARQRALGLEGVAHAFGLHPWTVAALDDEGVDAGLEALREELARGAAAALGETGLDRTRAWSATRERQGSAFERQLRLAREVDLPVVLHVVRAHGVALEVVDRVGPLVGMVHSWSGAPDLVDAWVARGFSLSFSATVVTIPKVRAAAGRVPLDRLLVETDAPDQGPPGCSAWEPAGLCQVVRAVAQARGEDVGAIAEATSHNARRMLGI